jgi:hypothetical protein
VVRCDVRNPKIQDLGQVRAIFAHIDQNVFRLEIAMDDAHQSRGRQRIRDLSQQLARNRPRQLAALLQQIAQTLAAYQLHDERSHVGMLELRGRHGFTSKTRRHLAVACELGANHLECHRLVKFEMLCDEHRAHAPFAQALGDAIALVEHATEPGVGDGRLMQRGCSFARGTIRVGRGCRCAYAHGFGARRFDRGRVWAQLRVVWFQRHAAPS